jgi:hypothetical protein
MAGAGHSMKIKLVLLAAAFGLAAPMSAQASTLSLTVTADNAYALYLSTDNSTMGTLIPGSNTYGGPAGQWSAATTYTIDLTAPVYYLHVIGSNYTPENQLWNSDGTPNGTGSNPNAFLGNFSISGGGGYVFNNNSTSLVTEATDWLGIAVANNSSWTTPINNVQSFGANGVAPWGFVSGISASAEWIWSNPDNAAYADLSTRIVNLDATPLPAALPLFASGLGAIGLLGWRRKRKKASATI